MNMNIFDRNLLAERTRISMIVPNTVVFVLYCCAAIIHRVIGPLTLDGNLCYVIRVRNYNETRQP